MQFFINGAKIIQETYFLMPLDGTTLGQVARPIGQVHMQKKKPNQTK
jgi:hypothetical protein